MFTMVLEDVVWIAGTIILNTHTFEITCDYLMKQGSTIGAQTYLKICDGHVVDLDWDAFVAKITRMKATPAFDAVNLKSPENEEFGDESVDARHFTAFSMEHSTTPGAELADAAMVKQLNPTLYLDEADVAKHWRIRSGHLAGNSRDPGDTPAQRGLRRGFCAAVGTSS